MTEMEGEDERKKQSPLGEKTGGGHPKSWVQGYSENGHSSRPPLLAIETALN